MSFRLHFLCALDHPADRNGAARRFGNRDGTGPYNFLVKGEGRALSVDTASRSGVAWIDLPPFDGKADASLQIGPALHSTALRDAVGFIHFDQFVNQFDYADASNALNECVSKDALAGLDRRTLRGRMVSFWGAFSLDASAAAPIQLEIVPVKLVIGHKGS